MNDKRMVLFTESVYIVIMSAVLILTSFNKLDSRHYIIICLFNVVVIQLMEMSKSRMNSFLVYRFWLSSFILLFVLFIYLQDVDTYFAHILLCIVDLLLLSNWFLILDNKIYRIYNVMISIAVTVYLLVGYIFLSSRHIFFEMYLLSSVLFIMFIPTIYYLSNRRRITNYMEYKKNIIIFLIVSWLISGVVYIRTGLLEGGRSIVTLFILISSFQYCIQNIFLAYYTGIVLKNKRYAVSCIAVGMLIMLTDFYFLCAGLLLIVNIFYVFQNHTNFGIRSKNNLENTYLIRISHLSNELTYNKDMRDYVHDSILQDLIYLKKAMDDEKTSVNKSGEILSNIISDLRLKLDNWVPLLYLDKSLYENLCININQVRDRHFDKRVVFDLFFDEKIYLESPYDELLLRVVRELVNNIYKHTNSNFAEIKVYIEQSILNIISFNDEGFLDEKMLYENNRFSGLIGICRTVHMIGGIIKVDNNKGVTITIKIPLKGGNIVENSISRRS